MAPLRAWDAETNVLADEATRHADFYGFALLAEKDQNPINPTDVSQWRFWIVDTKHLGDRTGSQRTITLASLKKEIHPDGLSYDEVMEEFETHRKEDAVLIRHR